MVGRSRARSTGKKSSCNLITAGDVPTEQHWNSIQFSGVAFLLRFSSRPPVSALPAIAAPSSIPVFYSMFFCAASLSPYPFFIFVSFSKCTVNGNFRSGSKRSFADRPPHAHTFSRFCCARNAEETHSYHFISLLLFPHSGRMNGVTECRCTVACSHPRMRTFSFMMGEGKGGGGLKRPFVSHR